MTLWWAIVPEMAWQAALVAGLIGIVLRAGSRWPAPLRHGLLLVALVKFIVPPLVTSPFSLQAVGGLWPSAQTVAGPGAADTAIVPPWWVTTAPAVHAIGTALVIAVMTAGHARLIRLRRRSRLVSDGRLAARRDAVVDRLGMTRRPVLLLSNEVESPIACGLRRPAIVMPASLAASLSTEELDAVIAHEAGHHRRRDVEVAALRALVCALWWWHPLAWITARAIRHAQEDACDDLVVSTGIVSADRYCDALIRSASALAPTLRAAAAFAERAHPLGRRIRRLLDAPASRRRVATLTPQTASAVGMVAVLLLPHAPASDAAPEAQPMADVQERVAAADAPRAAAPQASSLRAAAGVTPKRAGARASQSQDGRRPSQARDAVAEPSALPFADAGRAMAGFFEESIDAITAGFEPLGSPVAPETLDAPAPSHGDRLEEAARDAERRVYHRLVIKDTPEPVARRIAEQVGDSVRGEAKDPKSRPIRDAQRWLRNTFRTVIRIKLDDSPSPSPSRSPSPSPSPSKSPSESRSTGS